MQPRKRYWSSEGRGVGQILRDAFATDRLGSNAQIFFLWPQFLKSIKRNQINQTLGFKGAARLQLDEIADLFSEVGCGSEAFIFPTGTAQRASFREFPKTFFEPQAPRGAQKFVAKFGVGGGVAGCKRQRSDDGVND